LNAADGLRFHSTAAALAPVPDLATDAILKTRYWHMIAPIKRLECDPTTGLSRKNSVVNAYNCGEPVGDVDDGSSRRCAAVRCRGRPAIFDRRGWRGFSGNARPVLPDLAVSTRTSTFTNRLTPSPSRVIGSMAAAFDVIRSLLDTPRESALPPAVDSDRA
jgi:hypothetical protein